MYASLNELAFVSLCGTMRHMLTLASETSGNGSFNSLMLVCTHTFVNISDTYLISKCLYYCFDT